MQKKREIHNETSNILASDVNRLDNFIKNTTTSKSSPEVNITI